MGLSYFRRITYIDYFENGFKCGVMGHVKWEIREQECRIGISIRGLKEDGVIPVKVSLLLGNDKKGYKFRKLAVLDATDGSVSKSMLFSVNSIAGVAYEEISGLHFALSGRRYGVTVLSGETGGESFIYHAPAKEEEAPPAEPILIAAEAAVDEAIMARDKWSQLCGMYPVVHPLHNDQEYISISPKDFVIFPKEYQKLVHNSFLLHGFYNYQHIILGKYQEDYYLGVPGTYHDREALVAGMFGFEGFESVDKKETGTFGYYMTKVSI